MGSATKVRLSDEEMRIAHMLGGDMAKGIRMALQAASMMGREGVSALAEAWQQAQTIRSATEGAAKEFAGLVSLGNQGARQEGQAKGKGKQDGH